MSLGLTARIFTEAGPSVGLGHLGRCVALYDALGSLGCDCDVVLEGQSANHIVNDRRVRVEPWRESGRLVELTKNVDIAVLDSYLASLPLYELVASSVPVAVYIDDTARLTYPRGIVVNGSPASDELEWRTGPDTKLLLGLMYQLVRGEFTNPAERSIRQNVERVLTVAGGTDARGVAGTMRKAAAAAFPSAFIDYVEEPRTASEMKDAMMQADLAISAAGQTLYELAVTGTPSVAIIVADNQKSQARSLERSGTILLAGTAGDSAIVDSLQSHLRMLSDVSLRRGLSSRARSIIDGQGALRVARIATDAVAACAETGA